MRAPVVVTGLGALTPVGRDREATWRALCEGRSGVGVIRAFDPSGFSTRIAAEVDGFDPATVLSGKRLRRSTRATQFAVAAAREAVRDTELDLDTVDRYRIGIVLNSAVAGFDTIEAATRRATAARPRPSHPRSSSSRSSAS